ncbi:MAG: OmpA family protein [Pseudomonadota bacterium]
MSASVRDEPASILRPDIAAETAVEEGTLTESFTAVIGFPSGGSELDADALAELEQVRASTQFTQTGAIILRAHGDSAGSDVANERASEARGLAVAEWLIAAGAEPRRIDVIVFGEQNPTLPNAMPDGSPNEAGRAANRRVEIEILAPPADGQPEAGVSEPGDQP